eukprot:gene13384-13511_t
MSELMQRELKSKLQLKTGFAKRGWQSEGLMRESRIARMRQGVYEALQLQRCVVFFVLDGSGKVLALTAKCFVTNGLIYLGSIAVHHYVTSKAVKWLLRTNTERVYGSAAVAAWQHVLDWVFQLMWLLPLYGICLMVSCIW